MSKAVLVMDMPEQVCQKCTLCYDKRMMTNICAVRQENFARRREARLVSAQGTAGEERTQSWRTRRKNVQSRIQCLLG